MIEAVLFDLHGVVTSSPWAALARVGEGAGRSEDEVLAVVIGEYGDDGDHPWHRLERGELPLADYLGEVAALAEAAGFALDFDALRGFNEQIAVHDDVVACIRALRRAGIRTALVTNNVREISHGWRALVPAEELFDIVVDSSEVGVRKPNPAIFTLALERLGVSDPSRAVFLDDVESNVAGARRAGLHGIVVADTGAALAELDNVLASGRG